MSVGQSIINSPVIRSFVSAVVDELPENRTIQKGLLVTATATSVLSLIPGLRLAGALATRSIVLLSSVSHAVSEGHRTSALGRMADYSRIAAVGLGLIGMATVKPMLIIASLATDIGVQVIEMASQLRVAIHGDDDALGRIALHGSIIVVDSLMLAGIVTGSWPFLAVAAGVNMLVMAGISISAMNKDSNREEVLEPLCYYALMLLNFVSLLSVVQLTSRHYTDSHFNYENQSDERIVIIDQHGKQIVAVEPHEKASFTVPYRDTMHHTSYAAMPTGDSYSVIPVSKGSYLYAVTLEEGSIVSMHKCNATQIDTAQQVLKPTLAYEDFPTLPLGSPSVVMDPNPEIEC